MKLAPSVFPSIAMLQLLTRLGPGSSIVAGCPGGGGSQECLLPALAARMPTATFPEQEGPHPSYSCPSYFQVQLLQHSVVLPLKMSPFVQNAAAHRLSGPNRFQHNSLHYGNCTDSQFFSMPRSWRCLLSAILWFYTDPEGLSSTMQL